MSDATLLATKKNLRQRMLAERAGMAAQAPDAPLHLCDIFLRHISLPADGIISGYHALGHEMDAAPLLAALRARGHSIALPVVTGRGTNLIFRLYDPSQPLIKGAMGIQEPPPTAPEVIPDILIVPLLAFDRQGQRLGYGGGYYDRTLLTLRAQKPIRAVGVAYAGQEIAAVPCTLHDAPLDNIVTNTEFLSP